MKEITTKIDFGDSTYRSCEMDNENLTVIINSWDTRLIKIKFFNVIGFSFKEGSFLSGIYEDTEENYFLKENLRGYYGQIPQSHPYKIFIIKDIEDFSVFEVIAMNVSVIKEKEFPEPS